MLLAKSLLGGYAKSTKALPVAKLKKYAVIGLVIGVVGLLVTIALAVLVIRWAWNFGNTAVQQNPTISAVVENTKQQANELLPTVPSAANDFIENGQVNTAKLNETYQNLPLQTQQVWKNAMEASINDAITAATPQEVDVLRQLLVDIGKL